MARTPREAGPKEARPPERPELPGEVALVLQGGGALGAYQVGAFAAISEAGYQPSWFAGTSIGAINAAIMAGNDPEQRLGRLAEFWKTIGRNLPFPPTLGWSRRLFNAASAWQTLALGQPGFFTPRLLAPWLAPAGSGAALSFYDPAPLYETLARLIDLGRLNGASVRLSLGAVNIRTGRQVYFDSRHQRLGLEHIMASAALPPAFPPVEIGGEWYWDGGIVSNTPLDVVIDRLPRRSTLCFMIDLFDAAGQLPRSMEEVETRHKDILYASRSERGLESERTIHNLRRAVMALWERLPPEARTDPHLNELAELGCTTTMHVVRIVHRGEAGELASKDYEFSRPSITAHWRAGYEDAKRVLARPGWFDPVPADIGVIVHEASATT